ncbi:MAG TPA: hypothetical protein ENH55_13240 [Aurantimonas coralicida]|uniref:Phage tail protein n=2 Tax=root TaxID=1 RepID=A0A9C9NDM8_9HYPH|nr:hypothetical protein [Aurantimonas coralicida]HET99675.1 hypothetical protein [Aurantimonas coralicida]
MDERHRKLLKDGDRLFSERKDLDSFWQEVALNFYPEVATFTTTRSIGEEFADHLTTSYPLIARRTLGDAFSALLRPVNLDTTSPGVWFSIITTREEREDMQAKRWLEWATTIMRRAMYDRAANFVRATKEGDHAFATFGQCVLTIELNRARDTLLYRSWHLRDVAWVENAEGEIDTVHRKWKPTASQLVATFGSHVSDKVKEALKDNPYTKFECRHIVIAADNYEQRDPAGKRYRTPWVSVWIDVTNDYLMEEIGSFSRIYLIPRWVTVPGSQYASSPAVTAALPDARLIQAMTLTLLEAGEKFADPPMIATQEAIRTDIQLFAGGVTWVDAEYDEKLGEALHPLYHPAGGQGVSIGLNMRADVREALTEAFFLNSLSLPPADVRDMTAFETAQRISEWIRQAMPIFEPVEFEYNGGTCEDTFDLLMRNGAFGSPADIPETLRGADLQFKFESPLHESASRRKGQKFLEAKAALVEAVELDPDAAPMLKAVDALRDVLDGIGVPADWTRDERELEEKNEARRQAEALPAMIGTAGAAAGVAKDVGSAVKDFAGAQGTGQPAG